MWLVMMLGCSGGLGSPDNPYDSCVELYEIYCDVCEEDDLCEEDREAWEAVVHDNCESVAVNYEEGNTDHEWDRDEAACYNDAYAETCDHLQASTECSTDTED